MKDEEQEYWNNAAGSMVKWWGIIGLVFAAIMLIKMFLGIWD